MRRLILIVTLSSTLVACGGGNNTPPGQRPENTATPTGPSAAATTPAGVATTPTPAPTPTSTVPETYTVVAGDTLWDIAERFDTTIAAIVELNGLADADAIEIGQMLKLPGSAGTTPPAGATTTTPAATATQ